MMAQENLTNKEYSELLGLEYVLTQGYSKDEKKDLERYKELSRQNSLVDSNRKQNK